MMIPTSRCMSGVARPKDLRTVTRSAAGHLEKRNVAQTNSPDTDTHLIGFSRDSDFPQVFQSPSPSPVAGDSPVPLIVDAHPQRRNSFAGSIRRPSFGSQQTRGFHTSQPVPYDSTSYNVSEVPEFFVQYKQQRSSSFAGSDVHEHGLMQSLTSSILSDDVVATTRRLQAKVPVEHHLPEGHIVHSSGFVVPGPGHTSTSDVARWKEKGRNEDVDRAMQTAAVAHRVLESDFEHVSATTLPSLHKVPFEVREPDGTVKHPSGFVPPTPAHEFRYPVNMLRDRKVSKPRPRARQPSPTRAVLRAMHTAVPNAS